MQKLIGQNWNWAKDFLFQYYDVLLCADYKYAKIK